MKVKEFIEILQDFPQDSNIAFVNEYEDDYYFFFALHHTYECTIGFLLPLYSGASICYCDGLR